MKDKIVREIKKNKYTSIAVFAFVVLLVLFAILYKMVMPSVGAPVYGDRLEGIEKVEITKSDFDDLNKKVEDNNYVVSCTSSLSGKTVNVIVTVKDDTSSNIAKKVTNVVIKQFTKDQIDYYDFQVFIKNEKDSKKGFPIIGYKNRSNSSFSYSSAK